MKKLFQKFAVAAFIMGFVVFLGNDLKAQSAVFISNTRMDVSVQDMIVLKDTYENHFQTTLQRSELLQKITVSSANYESWIAVREELQNTPNADANVLEVVEGFVDDMSSKL